MWKDDSEIHSGILCPLNTPRFVCDEMLRGLGEWLRVAGYDTHMPEEGTEDRDVLAMAAADNIRELTAKLNLDWLHAPFSRCKRCNTPFQKGPIPGSSAPPDAGQQGILHCPKCRQTYWKGSHVQRMRKRLEEFNRWRRACALET